MNILSSFLKYFHTLKYLRPSHSLGRIAAQLKRKYHLYILPAVPKNLQGKIEPKINFLERDTWNSREEILKGNFFFSHEANSLGSPINWDNDKMTDACMLHINFFNFLFLLKKEEQIEICRSWIENNLLDNSLGWQPYGTSLRISSWIRAGLEEPLIDKSIYQQASYLYRNNEFYIPANHYLENAKSLIFAGIYFGGKGESKKWYKKGINIFKKETPKEVHADGGYFEKSLTYHTIVLQIFLDIVNILPTDDDNREFFVNTAVKMADYLKSTIHPDGGVALFSDSNLEMGSTPNDLLEYTEKLLNYKARYKNDFPHTGYYVFRNSEIFFIIDAGEIGPDYLPGHGHADIFSYELSIYGKRIVVDSGVSTYTESENRTLQRSTRAHNTLCIDGKDQAEMWGSFRTARRYKPKNISVERNNNTFSFSGMFDGYSKLIGDRLIHERKVKINENERRITITDKVTGRNDHLVESLIHLHPDAEPSIDENKVWIKLDDENTISILINGGDIEIEKFIYSPQLGMELNNSVLVLRKFCKPPSEISYTIEY